MIHLLYHGIRRLLTNMLKNFVSKRVLYRKYGVTMKPATQLKLISLNTESNLKSLNLIEGGTKAKRLLSASILDGTVFCKNCFKFYISAATKLQMKLPLIIMLCFKLGIFIQRNDRKHILSVLYQVYHSKYFNIR